MEYHMKDFFRESRRITENTFGRLFKEIRADTSKGLRNYRFFEAMAEA